MKCIVIYNHKGGVGKTTTAVNLAYNLTIKGHPVLIMDADPQGNASRQLRRYDLTKPSMFHFLYGTKDAAKCIRHTLYPRLDIIPADLSLNDIEDTPDNGADLISTVMGDVIAGRKYSYCMIDCPPGAGQLTRSFMRIADNVIIPLCPDRFSADGLGTCLDLVREYAAAPVVHGLITRFYRNRDTLAMVRSIMETQDVSFYDTVIRRCTAVDHSIAMRRPLMKCASRSPAARDYMDLAEEFLKKEGI